MTSFRVHLDEPDTRRRSSRTPEFSGISEPNRRFRRIFTMVSLITFVVLGVVGLTGYLYYQRLKTTPQYSLALLVDAAKRDDKQAIDQLVDFNAVVDDFLPQITDKAVELYGRGVPPDVIARMKQIAQPLLPAIKDRARAELPRVIRSRTEQFGYVPFFAMVMGADRYLDINVNRDIAIIQSKLPEHPLEMKMKRNGDRWQIIGIKDDKVATDIARTIGQQIIAIAANGANKKTAETLGVGNIADLLRQAEELVK